MKLRQKLFAGMLGVLAGVYIFVAAGVAAPEGETYYTKSNIWYEDAAKPIMVNYHKGTMIPVGTKAKIDVFKGDIIKFTTESKVTLTLLNSPKYSTIKLQELFDRCFSKENPAGLIGMFSKFNAKEKEAIKSGEINEGMSQEAVLMAYGYPPSHKTPDLKSNTWAYWDNRFVGFWVIFKDGRVSSIERGRRSKGE